MTLIEIIGITLYIGILAFVSIMVLFRSQKEHRKFISSLIFLIILIICTIFIQILVFQYLILLMIVVESFYIIYVHVLPYFYISSDKSLFLEVQNEIWTDIKVNETIIEEKKSGRDKK